MMTDEQLIELAGRAGLNIGYNKVGLITTEWQGPPLDILRNLHKEFASTRRWHLQQDGEQK